MLLVGFFLGICFGFGWILTFDDGGRRKPDESRFTKNKRRR